MSALQNILDDAHKYLTSENAFTANAAVSGGDEFLEEATNSVNDASKLRKTADGSIVASAFRALKYVKAIHEAAVAAEATEGTDLSPTAPLNGTQNRLTLNGLFEIIAIAGIQPSLSPGIGIPFEERVQLRVFQQAIQFHPERGESVLLPLIEGLSTIINGNHEGLKRFVRDRLLLDVVTGAVQLSYGPKAERPLQAQSQCKAIAYLTLDKTPIHYVLPLLTSLVQNNPPPWFKEPLLEYLALVPLRHNGVRNIVDFVASAAPSAYDENDRAGPGPALTTQSLSRASRLLSSVPSTMSQNEYFERLSLQLSPLLDGSSGSDMAKAAAYVIGIGILGKRDVGAPGKPGWEAFATPLLRAFNPNNNDAHKNFVGTATDLASLTLVSEQQLIVSLKRLVAIISTTPSPGLTKRLLGPIFLPVWGLHSSAAARNPGSVQTAMTQELLKHYVKRCATGEQLSDLASKLLWNGPREWTYGPGEGGGVAIRQRSRNETDVPDMMETMLILEQRCKAFVDIVDCSPEDSVVGAVFLEVSRRWLMPMDSKVEQNQILEDDGIDPFKMLVDASIAKAIIEHLQPRLAKNQSGLISLARELLKEYIKSQETSQAQAQAVTKPSYRGLEYLVPFMDAEDRKRTTESSENHLQYSDNDELASVALSLLKTFVAVEDFDVDAEGKVALISVVPELERLLKPPLEVSSTIRTNARNLLDVIRTLNIEPQNASFSTKSSSKTSFAKNIAEDRMRYNQALEDLSSSSPPLRVEAISKIKSLVFSESPVIDSYTLTHLLLSSALQDEEDYVYLAGIDALVTLFTVDSASTLRSLISAYADHNQERSLDERLRIGEAISQVLDAIERISNDITSTAQPSQPTLGPAAAGYLAEALIGISGRRGSRSKEAARKRQEHKRREREARRAWGGDVPEVPASLMGRPDDEGGDKNAGLRYILEGWQGNGEEEDVRMRTSALSLLGKLMELSLDSLGQTHTDLALEQFISLVRVETGPEKAVLRRAAILVVMGVVRGLDRLLESSSNNTEKVAVLAELVRSLSSNLEECVRELQSLRTSDGDDIVKDHSEAVLESIENWRAKALLAPRSGGHAVTSRTNQAGELVQGRLAGLDINPETSGEHGTGQRNLVEEIDDD